MTKPITRIPLLLLSFFLLSGFIQAQPVVHLLYFYSKDCSHCQAVLKDVLEPLQAKYGDRLAVHAFEIAQPDNYDGFARTTEFFKVPGEKRGIPTLVIGQTVLIGEDEIRQQLPGLVENGLGQGVPWPAIPGLEKLQNPAPTPIQLLLPAGPALPGAQPAATTQPAAGCSVDGSTSCSTGETIWVAYFYTEGCEVCSIAQSDLAYLRQKHPNVIISEFNIAQNQDVGQWLAEKAGRKSIRTPSVFAGNDALIGGEEMTPANLEALIQKHTTLGAARTWDEFDPAQYLLLRRLKTFAPLAGLAVLLIAGGLIWYKRIIRIARIDESLE